MNSFSNRPRIVQLLKSAIATAFQTTVKPFKLTLKRRIGGRPFRFNPSTHIGFMLLARGTFEPDEIGICSKLLADDSTVIDIGANIGWHSVHFASRCRDGLVVAIEPSVDTFKMLSKNMGGIHNVVALNVAVASDNRLATFYLASDDAYSGLKDTKRKSIVGTQRVLCYTTDHLLSDILRSKRIDLVKIDVEGLEEEVLSGMRSIMQTHAPVIFCEIYGGTNSNADPLRTIRYCESLGYRTYRLRDGALEAFVAHDDRYQNYFFIPATKLAEILAKL